MRDDQDEFDRDHPTQKFHPHVAQDGNGGIILAAVILALGLGVYWALKVKNFDWFDHDPRELVTRSECEGRLSAQMYVSLVADKNQTPFAVDRGPGMSAIIPSFGKYKFCADLDLEGVKPGKVSCEASVEVGD